MDAELSGRLGKRPFRLGKRAGLIIRRDLFSCPGAYCAYSAWSWLPTRLCSPQKFSSPARMFEFNYI
jgi:hypothetical protein